MFMTYKFVCVKSGVKLGDERNCTHGQVDIFLRGLLSGHVLALVLWYDSMCPTRLVFYDREV